MEIVAVIVPVFGLIVIGFALRWRSLIPQEWIAILNSFIYYVALPSLLIVSFYGVDWTASGMGGIIAFNASLLIGFAVVAWLLLRALPINNRLRASLFAGALMGNTIYMGFPIVFAALSDIGVESQITVVATLHLVLGIVLALAGIALFNHLHNSITKQLASVATNPLLLSVYAGLAVSLLPKNDWIELGLQPLEMIGASASPIALVALGAFMYGKHLHGRGAWIVLAAIPSIVLLPLLVLTGAELLSLSSDMAQVSALIAAMPIGVTAFVVAEEHRLDAVLVGSSIMLSTVISAITITGLIAWIA